MTEKATFGAGCFWGVEVEFRNVPGRQGRRRRLHGRNVDNPTYEQVCTDRTGHAEVVQVEFDPDEVSYEKLLGTFWRAHDPTQLNRQGPDVGSQYRSVVFFHTPEQQEQALASKARVQARSPPRRHRGRAGAGLLARRGVPPAVPGQARPRQLRDLNPDRRRTSFAVRPGTCLHSLGDADLRVRVHEVREPLRGARPGVDAADPACPDCGASKVAASSPCSRLTAPPSSRASADPEAVAAAEAVAASSDALSRRAALEAYAAETAGCTRCRLAQGRTQVVFGVGNPDADLHVRRRGARLPRGQAGLSRSSARPASSSTGCSRASGSRAGTSTSRSPQVPAARATATRCRTRSRRARRISSARSS